MAMLSCFKKNRDIGLNWGANYKTNNEQRLDPPSALLGQDKNYCDTNSLPNVNTTLNI